MAELNVTIKGVFLTTTAGIVYLIEVEGEEGQALLIPKEVFDPEFKTALQALKFKTEALGLRTITDVRADSSEKFYILRLVQHEIPTPPKASLH